MKYVKLLDRLNLIDYTDTRPNYLTIVGVRNVQARPNHYDDVILVSYKDSKGGRNLRTYTATTLPGTPALLKPINPKGTAVMVPGVYKDCYSLGLHKGKYLALVQSGKVKVWRDNDKDALPEKTLYVDEGFFGINIHRASLRDKLVGADSAGCQVIKSYSEFEEFIDLCLLHRARWGNKFTYTLVEA